VLPFPTTRRSPRERSTADDLTRPPDVLPTVPRPNCRGGAL